MNPGYWFAIITVLGTALYTFRGQHIWPRTGRWGRAAQVMAIVFWMNLTTFFWDIGYKDQPLLWRQWMLAGSTAALVVFQTLAAVAEHRATRRGEPT